MKTLVCTTGRRGHDEHFTVELRHYREDARLTPQMAREAAYIRIGHTNGVTVTEYATDPANGETWPVRAYRVTTHATRRLPVDP